MTSAETFANLGRLIEQGIDAQHHSGAQLAVWSAELGTLEHCWGETWEQVPMTRQTMLPWLSSGKPLTAVAVLQQLERDKLELDQPVATYLPAFGAGGKEAVTVRHLLTHTGGFRLVDPGPLTDVDATDENGVTTWQRIIDRICAAKLESRWVPGETAGYHPATSWFVLGELVRIVDGRSIASYLHEEICEPLGMTRTYLSLQDAINTLGEDQPVGHFKHTSDPDRKDHRLTSAVGYVSPGETLRSTAADMTRFYRMLLGGGELAGKRILEQPTVAEMTSRQRVGLRDKTFQSKMDWGLGVIVNSRQYDQPPHPYGYGQWGGEDAFGHSGNETSAAFADPTRGAAVALIFNGLPGATVHQERIVAALEALYEDLGWAND